MQGRPLYDIGAMHAYSEWAVVFCWHPLSLELKDIGWMEDIQRLPSRSVDCNVQRLFIDLLQPRRVRLQQTDTQTDSVCRSAVLI